MMIRNFLLSLLLVFSSFSVLPVAFAAVDPNEFYELLGVEKQATEREIKKAYKKLAMKYHPDRTGALEASERAEFEEMFKRIQEAHEVLTDPIERAKYDSGGYEGNEPKEEYYENKNRIFTSEEVIGRSPTYQLYVKELAASLAEKFHYAFQTAANGKVSYNTQNSNYLNLMLFESFKLHHIRTVESDVEMLKVRDMLFFDVFEEAIQRHSERIAEATRNKKGKPGVVITEKSMLEMFVKNAVQMPMATQGFAIRMIQDHEVRLANNQLITESMKADTVHWKRIIYLLQDNHPEFEEQTRQRGDSFWNEANNRVFNGIMSKCSMAARKGIDLIFKTNLSNQN